MAGCACAYHSLQKSQELTDKMKNLGVKRDNSSTQCGESLSQKYSFGFRSSGVKRNFSKIAENQSIYLDHDCPKQDQKVCRYSLMWSE